MHTHSIYRLAPPDPKALTLTKGAFGLSGDGIHDDTEALRAAIRDLKSRMNYGIIFLPEGDYLISDTLWIPKAVRLIGFGEHRPKIILGENAPGFSDSHPEDKGGMKYMVWFTDGLPDAQGNVRDANPGTFYSALSNIDFEVREGNSYACVLRTHYAQHSFVSHCVIRGGSARACMYDAGNEMEDMGFFGADYGLITTKCSPGWPFMALDCRFEDQRKSAILSQELGLTGLRLHFKNVPQLIDTPEGYTDRIYLEDCTAENVSGPAFRIRLGRNSLTQWNLSNFCMKNVPLFSVTDEGGRQEAPSPAYRVVRFTHGISLQSEEDPGAEASEYFEAEPLPEDRPLTEVPTDIPLLPDVSEWVSVHSLGIEGDASKDVTEALREAVLQHRILYFPQGVYRLSDTLELRDDSVLIGLNPISTKFVLPEKTPAFSGLGPVKPLLLSGRGTNIMNGLGVDAGAENPRAAGVLWRADAHSFMNDVKFLGGHGSMSEDPAVPYTAVYNRSRTADADPLKRWDSRYWSLFVTEGGGGIFKDVWTASPYAAAGFYALDTKTPSRIYCMSIEHHVRNEFKMKNVENWRIYALQTEEEVAEGKMCQPLEIENCRNLLFATLYLFRVIWLPNPYPQAVRLWNSEDIEWLNVSNFTQVKYTFTNTILDVTRKVEVRPWQFARFVSGKLPDKKLPVLRPYEPQELCSGFEFVDGTAAGPDGSFYFTDGRYQRIFRIDGENGALSLVRDVPFTPLSLAFDTEGRLLVVTEFTEPLEFGPNGWPLMKQKPRDARGTAYGLWYSANKVVKVYAIDPENPESTMQLLPEIPAEEMPSDPALLLHPMNRWRDGNDILEAAVTPPERFFAAPDGRTFLPAYYDLIRSNGLSPAVPGEKTYLADEYYKRILRFDTDARGLLSRPEVLAEHGEYSVIHDRDRQKLYAADGDLLILREDGKEEKRIRIPVRPATLALGGPDRDLLLITARDRVYLMRL